MRFRKGETVITPCYPWHVVALTDDDIYIKNRKAHFPRYSPGCNDAFPSAPSLSESAQNFLDKLEKAHQYSTYEVYEIWVALTLVESGKHVELKAPMNSNTEPHSLTKRSWRLVQEKIDYDTWEVLVSAVRERMIIVHADHPMMKYATDIVPTLSEKELIVLIRQIPGYSKSISALAVMKFLQDHLQQRMYAVFDPELSMEIYQHSCAPNCIFELSTSNSGKLELSLVALYDISDKSDLSIRLIENDDAVETRETAFHKRTGSSCGCLRCRYEASIWKSHPPDVNLSEAIQLGHFYFSAGNFEFARTMYEMTLGRVPDDPDLWHTLGAVSLAEKNFLEAQRVWKTASETYPDTCGKHQAIRLQLDKIAGYDYLSPLEVPSTESSLSWHAVVPQVFVTKDVINREICHQVIRWAEGGTWTTQRHYAVPTHDVPVHTVSKLLDWFKNLHRQLIQPLLASQFELSSNFYVHDAFCVKYEGGELSNHLPIHIDESTHSFVLALSDGYGGGGTYFYDDDTTVHLETGDLLSFKGDSVYHGGEVLTRGIRYIIAAFLYHDDEADRNAERDMDVRSKRPAGDLVAEFRKTKEQKASFSFAFEG